MRLSRSRLFSRIVPIVRDIGTWSDCAQEAFDKLDLFELCDPNLDMGLLLDSDARGAEEFDAQTHVSQVAQAAQ
jgi:hypothetical protein